jgi:hypothetical protein
MRRYFLLILAIAALAISQTPMAAAAPARICFKEVPNCIEGRFAEYWRQNGGLPVFGLPLNAAHQEQIGGKSYQAQLFERNRFELHPENRRPYDILLGRLGDERLRQLGRDWQSLPKIGGAPGDLCFFAQQTGHAVCSDFFIYFRTHGLEFDGRRGFSEAESIALFGLPISEAQPEAGSDGVTYLTQWFERARFEYHPENRDPYKILLGRLGAETTPVVAGDACAGIPPSVNATITPNCFQGGAKITLRAIGFQANEPVAYQINGPPGLVIPALLANGTLPADAAGVVQLTNTLPAGLPAGLYNITFQGRDSGKKGVIYFRILGN